jgi:hypothetical protein
MLLFPYMEQTSLYDLTFDTTDRWACGLQYDGGGVGVNRMFLNITGNEPGGEWQLASSWNMSDSGPGTWWGKVLQSQDDTKAFGSVPFVKCPTRRNGMSVSEAVNILAGPTGDYAFVVAWAAGNPSWNGSGNGQWQLGFVCTPWDNLRSDLSNMMSICHGPFRASVITPDYTSHSSYSKPAAFGISSWHPRDSMVWWQDGTSNQFIFGERFIPLGNVNSCSLATGHWDCSFVSTSVIGPGTIARAFKYGEAGFLPLQMPVSMASMSTYWQYVMAFGSWHPGVCNMLLGDGAVRGVSINTAVEGVLYPLSHTHDGAAVSLP